MTDQNPPETERVEPTEQPGEPSPHHQLGIYFHMDDAVLEATIATLKKQGLNDELRIARDAQILHTIVDNTVTMPERLSSAVTPDAISYLLRSLEDFPAAQAQRERLTSLRTRLAERPAVRRPQQDPKVLPQRTRTPSLTK